MPVKITWHNMKSATKYGYPKNHANEFAVSLWYGEIYYRAQPCDRQSSINKDGWDRNRIDQL
jgi:hypothetical protein